LNPSDPASQSDEVGRAYLQLIRLPNVFTALADVVMGYAVTQQVAPFPTLRMPIEFWLLLAASASLYCAGMVWNDVYDLEQDRRERPQRPLPSGRISLGAARGLGVILLAAGVGLASAASLLSADYRSALIGVLLAIAILLYDGLLKRTPLAPLVMGSCRFLNVLLGMSAIAGPWHTMHYIIAAGIGVYITGVTWFARTEARESSRLQLAAGTVVMAAGIGILATYPRWADAVLIEASWPRYVDPSRWPLVWTLIGLMIGWRCLWAVIQPIPQRVQYAVRNSIFSLIMLDGMVTFGVRGLAWAMVVLLLLMPTMYLGRWVYST
jgi:4-hydroxybenzoate polyprenyltransferase